MNYIKRRLKEPSTYAGLAVLVSALCPLFGVAAATTTAIATALGGVAVLVKEGNNQP
jgi:Na+-translocating ferredoxin:NAD+ oxidoreductase RnfE subunit